MSKKQVQALMLPTNEVFNPAFVKWKDTILPYIAGGELRKLVHSGAIPQHLYFTSNEEISTGDNYINIITMQPDKAGVCWGLNPHLRKVVATTDKSLNLPLIPQSFIEEYVKNKGEIKEVDITYYSEEPFTLSRDSDGEQEVIIEEKKQTLEEAAKEYFDTQINIGKELTPMDCVLFGAKWQQSNS